MMDFFSAHPYLTIWVLLILVFERAMYCGYIVDDDVCFTAMKNWKRKLFDKKFKKDFKFWQGLILQVCYGAGLFKNAVQEHAFTVALHGVNCCLIYRASGSLIAAVLYLVNPVNNQTAVWLNGRRYALSLLAVLLAWNFWCLIPFMILVSAIHVTGILFPLLFLWTPLWPAILPLGVVAFIVGRRRIMSNIKGRKAEYKPGNENQVVRPQKLILYVKTVGYQFFHCLIPLKPGMYHDFLFYFSSTKEGTQEGYSFNFDFWKGLAVVGLLGYLIIVQHSFWAFWFILFISQWCNIYSVTMNVADRYCSLPNVGAMILVSQGINLLPNPYNVAIFCFLFALYIIKYQPLFFAYRNVENFFQYHINLHPCIINPRFFLSKLYLRAKDPWQAFAVVRQGQRYRPHDFKLLLRFIECMFALGKPTSAMKAVEVAEKYIPYGEQADTEKLFKDMKEQVATYMDFVKKNERKVLHNNGKPYVNLDKKNRKKKGKRR